MPVRTISRSCRGGFGFGFGFFPVSFLAGLLSFAESLQSRQVVRRGTDALACPKFHASLGSHSVRHVLTCGSPAASARQGCRGDCDDAIDMTAAAFGVQSRHGRARLPRWPRLGSVASPDKHTGLRHCVPKRLASWQA
jgi:hypothetical protein